MGGPVVIETAKRVSNHVTGLVLVDILQNIEMKYSREIISYINSVNMDLVTAPPHQEIKTYL